MISLILLAINCFSMPADSGGGKADILTKEDQNLGIVHKYHYDEWIKYRDINLLTSIYIGDISEDQLNTLRDYLKLPTQKRLDNFTKQFFDFDGNTTCVYSKTSLAQKTEYCVSYGTKSISKKILGPIMKRCEENQDLIFETMNAVCDYIIPKV